MFFFVMTVPHPPAPVTHEPYLSPRIERDSIYKSTVPIFNTSCPNTKNLFLLPVALPHMVELLLILLAVALSQMAELTLLLPCMWQ